MASKTLALAMALMFAGCLSAETPPGEHAENSELVLLNLTAGAGSMLRVTGAACDTIYSHWTPLEGSVPHLRFHVLNNGSSVNGVTYTKQSIAQAALLGQSLDTDFIQFGQGSLIGRSEFSSQPEDILEFISLAHDPNATGRYALTCTGTPSVTLYEAARLELLQFEDLPDGEVLEVCLGAPCLVNVETMAVRAEFAAADWDEMMYRVANPSSALTMEIEQAGETRSIVLEPQRFHGGRIPIHTATTMRAEYHSAVVDQHSLFRVLALVKWNEVDLDQATVPT